MNRPLQATSFTVYLSFHSLHARVFDNAAEVIAQRKLHYSAHVAQNMQQYRMHLVTVNKPKEVI